MSVESPAGRPRKSGKTSASALTDVLRLELDDVAAPFPDETSLITQRHGSYRFDYLWKPKLGAKKVFVLFSGDAKRTKLDPPVFQRWKWADFFPGHCLYVSDPMLHMDPDIGLAWYAGTPDLDPLDVVAARLRTLLPVLGLAEADVTAYGSSGGGFAALRLLTKIPAASAISINPQTDITKFKWSSPDRYARVCLQKDDRHAARDSFPDRMDLLRHVDSLKRSRIVVVQNRLDTHHYLAHYKPFCTAMGEDADENLDAGNFRRILFDDPGGHVSAETPDVFERSLHIVESWT